MYELRQLKERLSLLRSKLRESTAGLKTLIEQEINQLEQKLHLLTEKLDLDED